MRRAYLDHAATTPMHPEAVEAMAPFLGERFGNPTGAHATARQARTALEDAREVVAAALGVAPGDVVFTSGGTESDNLAVFGVLAALEEPGPVVCAAMEHPAVLASCRAAGERFGVEVRKVDSDTDGVVDFGALAAALTPDVSLVSVMTVNNEIGTVQPVGRVADLVRRRAPGAVLHTDAVQAVPWLDVPAATAGADLVSVSAHKFGGPTGVGVLALRRPVPLAPVLFGGGQERERRSGSHDVAGIVATAAALGVTVGDRDATSARVAALRDRLVDGLLAAVGGSVVTGRREGTVAGHAHLRFAGIENEALVVLLDDAGVDASAGASCSSGALQPSAVLRSMGMTPGEAVTGVRFSLGWTTTEDDVNTALAVVPGAVARLRD